MANRVLKDISGVRQLSVKSQVPANVMTPTQIEQFMKLIEQFSSGMERLMGNRDDNQINKAAATNLYLRQLGLVPQTFQPSASSNRFSGEQVAGFYNPLTKSFITSSRVKPSDMETLMAHELTHALQDQHFNLLRFAQRQPHESDENLALSSLVEGDATLVMLRYMTAHSLKAFGMSSSGMSPSPPKKGNDSVPQSSVPSHFQHQTLFFPYTGGLKFATELQAKGGWNAVSRAYSRPPKSTQQILHFDQYLANKMPVKVSIPKLLPALGTGWKLLDHDVRGELGLSLVMGQFIDQKQANMVSAGWAGDRYAVYSGPKGAVLVVQDTLWNDTLSATNWNAAYALRTQKRFGPRASSPIKNLKGERVSIWNAATNTVCTKQNGRRVIVLEGTTGAFDVARILKELHA